MKKTLIALALLTSITCSSIAATITITGPTSVCPNVQYTYTASASNAFGSQKGCFSWSFWIDNKIVSSSSLVSCGSCSGQSSQSTKTFIWNTLSTNAQVKVQFVANDQLPGCKLSEEILNVVVRVVMPQSVSDANGGLSFCAASQTKTITSPQSYSDPAACLWDNNYDWIVPSGWKIIPNGSLQYTVIPGGIRTKSPNVSITAPSPLLSGNSGNYLLKVRTEPSWAWP
jgi:hypothetical protein